MSKAAVVYTLTRQAVALGAHKSTRAAVDAAAPLLIPRAWRDTLDAAALHAATKPLSDPEHLCTTCYRCATVSAGVTLLSRSRAPAAASTASAAAFAGPIRSGDRCPACEQPYVRCMLTFEVLPLVEFVVPDATPEAVLRALEQGGRVASSGGSSAAAGRAAGGAGAASTRGGAGGSSGQDVLHFDGPDAGGFGSGGSGSSGSGFAGLGGGSSGAAGNKAFNALLQEASTASIGSVSSSSVASGGGGPAPVSCPLRVLELLPPSEVFVTGRGTAGISSGSKSKAAAGGSGAGAGTPAPSASSSSTSSAGAGGRLRFWKSVIPDIGVASCGLCDSFFSLPDFEFECLKAGGACPVCKHKRA